MQIMKMVVCTCRGIGPIMQSRVERGSGVAARGRNDLLSGRLAVSPVTGDQLSVYAGTRLNGNGFVSDITTYFTPINELDAFAGNDVADDFAGDRNILRTNVAMNLAGGSDKDPPRLAIRLFEISLEFAIDTYAFVDMQCALEACGVTNDGTYALHGLAV